MTTTQLFGQKSEKRQFEVPAAQLHLGELPIPASVPPVPGKAIAGHIRRARSTDYTRGEDASGLFFDETRVPVQTIAVPNPEIEGLGPDQYEVIGEKVSHRLAQRPGSYVILKYVRPLIKRRDTATIHCPPAPAGVIEGSRADVSFLVALLLDKFAWHLPLYRQHQRLLDAGHRVRHTDTCVGDHAERDAGGQRLLDVGHPGADLLGHRRRAEAGRFEDVDADRGFVVVESEGPRLLRRVAYVGEVAEPDHPSP